MGRNDRWLLADVFRLLAGRRESAEVEPEAPDVEHLKAACEVLMSDVGEASIRAVATRALNVYEELTDIEKLEFFRHVLQTYGVDADALRQAYQQWNDSRSHQNLNRLFTRVEPRRQQLLRRIHYAPGATLALVKMRADLRHLMRTDPEIGPLDEDFRHLLTSWFNRGFLRMEEITWDSPRELHEHLLRYEKVHPMKGRDELRRRLQPKDRLIYAFFHPATENVPLIFVEVALVKGLPEHISPLLRSGATLSPAKADTAALYSINNALDGLAGVSFGNLLIKQVIDQASDELPHLENFVTLSPIPGFRRWLDEEAQLLLKEGDPSYSELVNELRALGGEADEMDEAARKRLLGDKPKLPKESMEGIRSRLFPALTRYIAHTHRRDGKPVDPVARFHLGNGASAWQLNWPANPASEAWAQSYGAMINYVYEPAELERRHEEFMRNRTVALGPQLEQFSENLAQASRDRASVVAQ